MIVAKVISVYFKVILFNNLDICPVVYSILSSKSADTGKLIYLRKSDDEADDRVLLT